MINARAETVTEKPAFRAAWAKPRRCVVPADAFYEWQRTAGGKQPYAIASRAARPWDSPACGKAGRTRQRRMGAHLHHSHLRRQCADGAASRRMR